MRSRVTVQDIADALNLSRTTVSKVLNQSASVSDATRTLVLDKAAELGYRTWGRPDTVAPAPSESEVSCFAMVMHAIPGGNHMGTVLIPSMDQKLRQEGISLFTCAVSDEDYETMQLPPILSNSQTKAIVCLEMFNPEYSKLLCSLGKPILFIDGCIDFFEQDIGGSVLLMENRNSTSLMLKTLIRKHKLHTVGFVGDAAHCISFQERYQSFMHTVFQEQVSWEPYCIIDDDSLYGNVSWLQSRLEAMTSLPQLFFCANDFLATALIEALTAMGKQVPGDVMVCGFDGMASITWPLNQLTTVVTPTDQLGLYAANILLREMTYIEPVSSITHLKTKVLFRETAP